MRQFIYRHPILAGLAAIILGPSAFWVLILVSMTLLITVQELIFAAIGIAP